MKNICKKIIIILLIFSMVNSYIIPLEINMVYAIESSKQEESGNEDNNIPLVFTNEEFKQKIIDYGWDDNNDGEITKTEISNISWIYDAPDIEFAEFFTGLTTFTFKLKCTVNNYLEEQQIWIEKLNKLPNKDNLTTFSFTIELDLGDIPYDNEMTVIDVNNKFSTIINYCYGTFKGYSESMTKIDSSYSESTDTSISWNNGTIEVKNDLMGEYKTGFCISAFYNDEEELKGFNFLIKRNIVDNGNIMPLSFESTEFKQYLIDNGYDTNGDNEITKPEIQAITSMFWPPHIEYPEYFSNLTLIVFKVICTSDNYLIEQEKWIQDLEKLPHKDLVKGIHINLNLGDIPYNEEDLSIDVYKDFSKIITYCYGEFDKFSDESYNGSDSDSTKWDNGKILVNRKILGEIRSLYCLKGYFNGDSSSTVDFDFWITGNIIDGGSNPSLAFQSENFKQYLLDSNVDKNGDGEINLPEIRAVNSLYNATELEYPEYFTNLTDFNFTLKCTLDNYLDEQDKWIEKLRKLPNQQINGNIKFNIELDCGKIPYNLDDYIVNINDEYSKIIEYCYGTFKSYSDNIEKIGETIYQGGWDPTISWNDGKIVFERDKLGTYNSGYHIIGNYNDNNEEEFYFSIKREIIDDGNIPNLTFKHEDFKQAIINCGYDKNNDGEINILEMKDIYVLDCGIKHLEYPEYLQQITTLYINMDCTLENLSEVQQNWKEQIDKIPSESVKNNIYFNVNLDLEEKEYCDESIEIDVNKDFSTILSYYNGLDNSYIDINWSEIPYFNYSGIEYENNIIKIQQDILGKHSYNVNLSVFDEYSNSKPFGITISIDIIDNGVISNLDFNNTRFKQYLIDYGYDLNNDGEINRPEIYNINWLGSAPDIEYPEYFKNLSEITFKLECTLENAKEKQKEIEEKAKLIANKNCYWQISSIKVDIGELRQSQDNYVIDLNEYFGEVMEKYPYTFKDYSVDDYEHRYPTNTISLQDNKIIIDRNIIGQFDMYLSYNMIDEYGNQQSIYYEFIWTTLANGDETKEVEFEDNRFKNYVLNNFDYNGDGIITEFEMAQVITMDMYTTNAGFEGGNITSLKGIEYAKNLKTLYVNIYNNDSDISYISQLTNLENLSICNGDLKDYLKELINLKTVNIGYSKLDVYNLNNNIVNFSYYGYNLTNIDSIKYKNNLTTFSLWNMNSSEHVNYDFLSEMDKLQSIQIEEENGNVNIENLKDLENLNMITLRNMTLNNIEHFNDFKSNDIRQIELRGCKISNIDFIKKFTKLYYIDLRNNNITDISVLNGIFKDTNTWNYANLTGNSINPNKEGNAETIEYFKNNNIDYRIDEYDESEEVIFKDENLKNYLLNSTYPKYDTNNDGKISQKEMKTLTTITINNDVTDISGLEYAINLQSIDFNCYNETNNMDLTPLSNLENIEKIQFMCEFSNMNGFNFIKNKSSLKEIYINNYPHKFDFDGIENFVNLETIELHINGFDGDEMQLLNTQKLKQLIKLNKLDIRLFGGTIPATDISSIPNLNSLELSGKIDDINKIFNLRNLTYLSLDNNWSANNQKYDLTGIEKLENLKQFKYSGEIDNIINLLELNKILGLEKIVLSITNNIFDYSYSMADTYKKYMIKEQNFVDYLQNLECNGIEVNSSIYSYIGEVQVGQEKTISYEDISPLVRALITPNNKLYNENVFISDESGNNSCITINSSNKTITIKATENIGEQSAYLRIQNNYGTSYDGMYSNSLYILWKNIIPGDTNKKIEFEDDNLRNVLLERYDIDDDKEITENDIINIKTLDIYNCNINSLEGLQNAKNLTEIYASNNRISDITPIINLEKLEVIIFYNNIITDISCIKDAKWSDYIYDEMLDFSNNFINFEENNENYNALKKWMYRDIPENYVSLPFIENINRQNYGTVSEIDNEVVLEGNLKNKLIEFGTDTNKDGIITRRELYNINQLFNDDNGYKLDLSNSNIKNISGLEFVNADTIDLSNNEIEDITPITKNNNIYDLNLSNNKIINITGIGDMFNTYILNLSNNKISNIEPITNMYRMQEDPLAYNWCYGYRMVDINLSNNEIIDISCVKNWKNIYNLDLTNNLISDISELKEYNFNVSQTTPSDEIENSFTIDLSNNYIDMNNNGNQQAKNIFDAKGANLTVDNQNILLEDGDNTGIKIEVNQNVISENVELVVDEINVQLDENISEVINNIPNTDKNTKYQVFDIKLVNDNLENVETNGNVTVFIPIPKGFSNKTKVYYINLNDLDNSYLPIESTIETIDGKKYAKFETNHFSYYSIVDNAIIGDVNGDGKVNVKDWNRMYNYINETVEFTEEEFERSDVNGDGKVNIKDWNRMYNHINGTDLLY